MLLLVPSVSAWIFSFFFLNIYMDAVYFSWGVNAVTGCYRGMGRAVAGLCSLLELLGRR